MEPNRSQLQVSPARCPECGAEVAPSAYVCWLCRKPLPDSGEIVMAELVPEKQRLDVVEVILAISTVIIVGVMLLIGIGCFATTPGMGFVYLLFSLPPLLVTLVRGQTRKARGERVTWADRLLTLVLSSAVSAAIGMVLAFAAFVAFFIYCWYEILKGAH